ncbi:hypothetical protein Hanom_Chr09g00799501 [Helianthus anomalus]
MILTLIIVSTMFELVLQEYTTETWSCRDSRGICSIILHVHDLCERYGGRGELASFADC